MFRRVPESLPPDFTFPNDLKGLGYFINDKDRIRQIAHPERRFHYFISKNERYVDMHKEAMSVCVRRIIAERLYASGFERTLLPRGTTETEPHVPILTTANLGACARCVVYIGEPSQELGVLAGRLIDQESVAAGSVLCLVAAIRKADPDGATGLVIANPAQLLWHRRGRRALSYESWNVIPRPSAVSPTLPITPRNHVPRNHDPAEHIACLFEDVVAPLVQRGVKVDVIAAGAAGGTVVDFVQKDWPKWAPGLNSIVVTTAHIWTTEFSDKDFQDFWGKRCRAYSVSTEPLGTPLAGRPHFGCNIYSSGEATFLESVVARAHVDIVDYLRLLYLCPNYKNTPPDIDEEAAEQAGQQREPDWGANGDLAQATASPRTTGADKVVDVGEDEDALAKAMEATKLVLKQHKAGAGKEGAGDADST